MTSYLSSIAAELPEPAVRTLEEQLNGEVVRPGDAAYHQARQVWNAAVDRSPALIIRPRDASDVIHAVEFARANDLSVAGRSASSCSLLASELRPGVSQAPRHDRQAVGLALTCR